MANLMTPQTEEDVSARLENFNKYGATLILRDSHGKIVQEIFISRSELQSDFFCPLFEYRRVWK